MEQRIQQLEDELKLIKTQIWPMLLDIKANIVRNDWDDIPSPVEKAAVPISDHSESGGTT
jgi:hypothetical protein